MPVSTRLQSSKMEDAVKQLMDMMKEMKANHQNQNREFEEKKAAQISQDQFEAKLTDQFQEQDEVRSSNEWNKDQNRKEDWNLEGKSCP